MADDNQNNATSAEDDWAAAMAEQAQADAAMAEQAPNASAQPACQAFKPT